MSQANLETLRDGYSWFREHGRFPAHLATDDFIWDMSHFQGWPEQQVYDGIEGADEFLSAWSGAWDDWRLEVLAMYDAGDSVVSIIRQSGTSKLGGMATEMSLAMVWTFRDGLESRMDMYSDPQEAMSVFGVEG
jgi:ketosteroid isomerase-like protein